MTAKYTMHQNCSECLDYNFIPDCVTCTSIRTRKVEILQLGVGFFGNKAVVKDVETGNLATVLISELKDINA